MQTRSDQIRKGQLHAACILLMLLAVLLIATWPSGASAATKTINSNGVSGKITNLDWDYVDIDPHFDIDLDWDDRILWIFPTPTLKMGVKITIGGTGDFDLNITQGNLRDGTPLDTKLSSLNHLGEVELKKNIFDYVPKLGAGIELGAVFRAGASHPVKVKGHFDTKMVVSVSKEDGLESTMDPKVDFTSIIPQEKDQETFVAVMVGFRGALQLGVIGYDKYTIGPLMNMEVDSVQGARAVATLHKDEFEATYPLSDDVHTLHSCTANGKDGCVSGQTQRSAEKYIKATAYAKVPVINYKLIDKSWSTGKKTENGPVRDFVQSVTWHEKLKYQEYCDHLYYKVPVRVWQNENKTIPFKDINVHPTGIFKEDDVARLYENDITGRNPELVQKYAPYGTGRANIYLPYIDGSYTILADTMGTDVAKLTGQADQPTPMRRGENDPVDIIMESRFNRKLSVKKEWDIDYAGQDRPDSIEVLLQAQHHGSGYFTWETVEIDGHVQKATLNAANNWTYEFPEVPKYEIDSNGKPFEIKYRIRELKEDTNAAGGGGGGAAGAGGGAAGNLFDDAVGVVQQPDGLMRPDPGNNGALSRRVVPGRTDLDNIHVWEVLKSQVTTFDQLWQITPTLSYFTRIGLASALPQPTVTYHVDAYTTPVGEQVEAHETKYQVGYEEEGDLTTITNTAIMDMAIYKRWFMFGDAEVPDEVWLMLGYRVKEQYRELAAGMENIAGMWLPVWKPLSGDVASVFNAIASITGQDWLEYADYLVSFDVSYFANLKFAIARVKKPDGLFGLPTNPLTDWRAKFRVKKYGWLAIPGVPVEFQAQELSSAIVTDVLKLLTGLDIPISFSLNPFSGQMYLTVPGKLYQIPLLDKDWERAANVINTWYEGSGSSSIKPSAIGGTKYWKNDREEDRPDTLTVQVEGRLKAAGGWSEVGSFEMKKSENEGRSDWVWSLTSENESVKAWLDSIKETDTAGSLGLITEDTELSDDIFEYRVTEEYPSGYSNKDKYQLEVDGFDLINTWCYSEHPALIIRKTFEYETGDESMGLPAQLSFTVKDGAGTAVAVLTWNTAAGTVTDSLSNTDSQLEKLSERSYRIVLREKDGWTWTHAGNTPSSPDLSSYTVEETVESDPGAFKEWKNTGVTGPEVTTEPKPGGGQQEKDKAYAFSVTNRGRYTNQKVKVVLNVVWQGDEDDTGGRREVEASIRKTAGGEAISPPGTFTIGESDSWTKTFDEGWPRDDADGKAYDYEVTASSQASGNGYSQPVVTREVKVETSETEGSKTVYIYTITLTRTVKVTGRKTWEDDDNSGSTRPDSLRVNINDDVHGLVQSLDVTEADNWEWTVENLPRFTEDGQELHYSVTEGTASTDSGGKETVSPGVPGYTQVSAEPAWDKSTNTWTCDITNSTELVNIPVRKEWADDDDSLGIRPDSVTVRLFSSMETEPAEEPGGETGDVSGDESGEEGGETVEAGDADVTEVASAELNEENGWLHIFTGMPKKEGLTYYVEEDPVDGYMATIEKPEDSEGFVVTNTPDDSHMNVHVTKVWEGDEENENCRPGSVTVRLFNGDEETAVLEITEDKDWKGVIPGVPKADDEGQPIAYTLKEDPVGAYAEGEVTGSAEEGFTVTNRFDNTMTITVRKEWVVIDEDQPSFDMDMINFTLARYSDAYPDPVSYPTNGVHHLYRRDDWQTQYLNAEVYDDQGNPYTYFVKENLPGYTPEYTQTQSDDGIVLTIWNTPIEWMNTEVRKVWDDGNDPNRPAEIQVNLLANGQVVHTRTMTSSDFYLGSYDVFDSEGNLIVYTVEENPVPAGYISSVTGNMQDGFTITNTKSRENRTITVQKVWDDKGAGAYTGSVTIRLLADGVPASRTEHRTNPDTGADEEYEEPITAVLTAEEGWACTFPNLPFKRTVNEDGTITESLIEYTVTEDEITGYTTEITGSMEEGFTVTNTREVLEEIRVTKVWDDENDVEGKRPDSISLHLMKNGTDYQNTILSGPTKSGNVWEYVIRPGSTGAFPVYENGEPVEWTLEETRVNPYEEPLISGNADDGFTIVNRYVRTTTDFTVIKEWMEDDTERPEVTVNLLSDADEEGVFAVAASHALNEGNNWKYVFKDQPIRAEDDRIIRYKVEEVVPEGYAPPFVVNRGYTFEISNWKALDASVAVEKTWTDDQPEDRPASVSFNLKNGNETVQTVTLTPENDWQDVVNVPFVDGDGNQITYTLEENEPDGYTSSIISETFEDISLQVFSVENVKDPPKVDIEGKVVWDDVNDQDGIRPASVIVMLYKNGEKIDSTTVTAGNGWTFSFTGLNMYDQGVEISYTVDERPVDGYSTTVDGYTITNKHTPGTVSVSGTKTWNDGDDQDGIRPDSVTIKLLKNGAEIDSQTTTADRGWKYSFANLPKAEQGTVIRYTVKEDPVPDGYTAKVSGNNITNSHAPDKLCTITYDPNGGTIDGSRKPVKETHHIGDEITIRSAPSRSGYDFLYWKGSKYYPGDSYTVTGDHTFVAQWSRIPSPYTTSFVFTKKWSGAHGDSIDWTLYDPDGRIVHKKFNKKVISDSEWRYDAWFSSDRDYYIIETVPAGYKVRYENVGRHADVKDRCYNGGTIINYRIPKTGDDSLSPALWIGCIVLGVLGTAGVLIGRKRAKNRHP